MNTWKPMPKDLDDLPFAACEEFLVWLDEDSYNRPFIASIGLDIDEYPCLCVERYGDVLEGELEQFSHYSPILPPEGTMAYEYQKEEREITHGKV